MTSTAVFLLLPEKPCCPKLGAYPKYSEFSLMMMDIFGSEENYIREILRHLTFVSSGNTKYLNDVMVKRYRKDSVQLNGVGVAN